MSDQLKTAILHSLLVKHGPVGVLSLSYPQNRTGYVDEPWHVVETILSAVDEGYVAWVRGSRSAPYYSSGEARGALDRMVAGTPLLEAEKVLSATRTMSHSRTLTSNEAARLLSRIQVRDGKWTYRD